MHAPRFSVVAHSSGGPYALACAVTLPDRVSGVALVSCVAPYDFLDSETADDDQALTGLAREDPERAAAQIAESAAWLVENPDQFLDIPRPEPDVQLLTDRRIRTMLFASANWLMRARAVALAG